MKKYDKTFFMMYEKDNFSNTIASNGIDEFAKNLGKTRKQALTSLRRYLKNDNYIKNKEGKKFIVLNQFILERGKKNERKRHKKSK